MNTSDSWRPSTTNSLLGARAQLLLDVRDFFLQRDVMEVETPVLSVAGNTDPEIRSVRTPDGRFLRTSPEFAHKRLLASGSGDIYELGRVFRADESGRSHNPEFTMLEWYRTDLDYHQLMTEVDELVRRCGHGKFDDWAVERISYRNLFQRHLDLDPFTAGPEALENAASKRGFTDVDLDHKGWLDLLMSLVIQPAMPEQQLTFVFDYPPDQAALARIRHQSQPVAERFELYLGRVELANGYQELTDAAEQQRRFEQDNAQRTERGQETCVIDTHLISALDHGLPECAGVALGIDRLLMVVCGVSDISEVMAFPALRA